MIIVLTIHDGLIFIDSMTYYYLWLIITYDLLLIQQWLEARVTKHTLPQMTKSYAVMLFCIIVVKVKLLKTFFTNLLAKHYTFIADRTLECYEMLLLSFYSVKVKNTLF